MYPPADQMGVELGKVLAKNILSQLDKPQDVAGHDSSVRHHFPNLNVISGKLAWILIKQRLDHRPHSLLSEVAQRVIGRSVGA